MDNRDYSPSALTADTRVSVQLTQCGSQQCNAEECEKRDDACGSTWGSYLL